MAGTIDIFFIFEDVIVLAASLWVLGTFVSAVVYIVKVWLPQYLEHHRK